MILERDLITIDLEATSGYPSIDVPHPIDFHESPVSSVKVQNHSSEKSSFYIV